MSCEVYLSLGSNMGDREMNLKSALDRISRITRTTLKRISCIYDTEPVGYTEQSRFLNTAAAIDTELEPLCLLKELQQIELDLKRVRDIRWGPRTIDIDMLLYGDRTIAEPQLAVPHPRMFERAFVLIPLKDIYKGNMIHGRDINDLISSCADRDGVKLYGTCDTGI